MAWFGKKSAVSTPSTTSARPQNQGPKAADDRIRQIGQDLLERARGHKAGLLSAQFYSDALMNWSMKDPVFKVQLFRFVDCFPVLRTAEDVFDHLQDYLSQPGVTVPKPIAAALAAGKLAKGLAASQMSKQITGMAEKFIAGTDAASALPNLRALWDNGIAFSVDLLGEACLSDAEADAYRDKYLDLINNLPGQVAGWPANARLETDHLGPIPRTNVSVKISSLSARCDPIDTDGAINDLLTRLVPILQAAAAKGVFVNFDMEQFALKDLTLELLERCCERVNFHAGLAMQAYLRSGPDDAARVVAWAKRTGKQVTVRLVKGAYWDYETINAEQRGWPCPVWPTKAETDACFERMACIFLDSTPTAPGQGGVKLALGSHNARSIAATVAYCDSKGLPRNAVELQMLHGMADQLKHAAADMGLRVREYVPVGQMIPGMAYLVRRLLENTSNESWLKAGFLDNADTATLLADPVAIIAARRGGPKPLNSGETTGDANTIKSTEPSAANLERAPERHNLGPGIAELKVRPFYNAAFRDFADKAVRTGFAQTVARTTVPAVPSDRTPAQASEMVGRAAAALEAWREVPVLQRSAVLLAAAEIMSTRRDELSAVMIKEAGKTWREADADTCEAIDFCTYYAQNAVALFNRQRIGRFVGELDEVIHEPRGVAVVIAPWNFPLAICCGMTVAALVTGNTVVVKPAEQTTGIAKLLVDILHEALARVRSEGGELSRLSTDTLRDTVHFCPAPGETTGAALVRDPRVALIAFTGSRDVGCDILHAAAPASPFQGDRAGFAAWASAPGAHVKHVVCEMGGKNALIIDTSADLDEAVLAARHSAFGFQGQKCSALSRLIVVDPQGPDGPAITHFRERLIEATRALSIGDPARPGTDIGPVIDAEAKAKIEGFVSRAKASGLRHSALDVPVGLEAATGRHFVAPHIFWTVPEDHELAQQEIFGPVLAIMHAGSFEDALRIANSLPYKLTGGVFTRKPAHLELAKRRFRVGNLYINRGITGALVARQPFGGFGMSGVGSKAGGAEYLHHFVLPRAMCENTMRRGFAPEL
jgi:RHH-type transcriptional regulator, proline utilization regulon repressor / proline dehydrogenase / delta 1-pyrroline-5-carboxylate dehydrogenase